MFLTNLAVTVTGTLKAPASRVSSERDKDFGMSFSSSKLPEEWQEAWKSASRLCFFPSRFEDEEILLNHTLMYSKWSVCSSSEAVSLTVHTHTHALQPQIDCLHRDIAALTEIYMSSCRFTYVAEDPMSTHVCKYWSMCHLLGSPTVLQGFKDCFVHIICWLFFKDFLTSLWWLWIFTYSSRALPREIIICTFNFFFNTFSSDWCFQDRWSQSEINKNHYKSGLP